MDGQTTFLDEFNATAPDLSREVNVMVVGGGSEPINDHYFDIHQSSFNPSGNIAIHNTIIAYEGEQE